MSDLHEIVAATIHGQDVSLYEVLYFLNIHQKTEFLQEALNICLVSQAIAREDLTVSNEELQQAVDEFRRQRRLYKTADTQLWLQEHHMSVRDLERRLEYDVAARKLREKVTVGRIERYFAEHKAAFDRAKISHILVKKEGVASEIFSQITEEEADFAVMARRHSIDKATRDAGGYLGTVTRRELNPALEATIFATASGSVVGPVKTSMGYHVIQVHSLHPSELDESTRAMLQQLLYDEWLQHEMAQANLNVKLLQLLKT